MSERDLDDVVTQLKVEINAITAHKPAGAIAIALCESLLLLVMQPNRTTGFREIVLEMLADMSEKVSKL